MKLNREDYVIQAIIALLFLVLAVAAVGALDSAITREVGVERAFIVNRTGSPGATGTGITSGGGAVIVSSPERWTVYVAHGGTARAITVDAGVWMTAEPGKVALLSVRKSYLFGQTKFVIVGVE